MSEQDWILVSTAFELGFRTGEKGQMNLQMAMEELRKMYPELDAPKITPAEFMRSRGLR